ncbi:MAG: hypothetical protein ACLQOO_30920 [Terriglobia bacterium]
MRTIEAKEHAHELIERLAPAQVAAVRLPEAMLDPVFRAIANAAADEEPLTPEEKKALDEAQDRLKHNRDISREQFLAELGLARLIAVESVSDIPDFRSDDEIAAWYQTHSTVLMQDQLESLPAQVGGRLGSRLAARRSKRNQALKLGSHPQPAKR